MLPRVFGNYTLLRSLGHGGMGEVFLARSRGPADIERLCVIKLIRSDADDKSYERRLVDEARVMAQLNHGNICHLVDVGEVDGQLYLAMEHIFGVTLKRFVFDRRVRNTQEEFTAMATWIVAGVLDGLDYAHRNKDPRTGEARPVIHRDISPQNVMVNTEGEVKLIDFGLADSAMKTEKTESGMVMGKISYMSPEQARGDVIGPASDQFTAAVLAYEIFSGKRFYNPTLPPHVVWGMSGSGGNLPDDFDALPRNVRVILHKALRPDADSRYASCAEFKDALLDAVGQKARGGHAQVRDAVETVYGQELRDDFSRAVNAEPQFEMAPPKEQSMPMPVAPPRTRQTLWIAAPILALTVLVGAIGWRVFFGEAEETVTPPIKTPLASSEEEAPVAPANTTHRVRFESRPSAATVVALGQSCETPCVLEFERGTKLSARFTKSGFKPVEEELLVQADAVVNRELPKVKRERRRRRRVKVKADPETGGKNDGRIRGKNAVADPYGG